VLVTRVSAIEGNAGQIGDCLLMNYRLLNGGPGAIANILWESCLVFAAAAIILSDGSTQI